MVRFAFLLLLTGFIAQTAPSARAESDLQTFDFFENSFRVRPTRFEDRFMLRALRRDRKSLCSGFLVHNREGRFYVGTARHCYDYDTEEACRTGKLYVVDREGREATCRRVVLEKPTHDFAIVEVEFARRRWQEDNTLVLGGAHVAKGTLVRLVGFPGDYERNGSATSSRRCWITSSPVKVKFDPPREPGLDSFYQRFNCSVYGGNSGGPVIAEGTRVVIGLPGSYRHGDYEVRPADSTKTPVIDSMADFVNRYGVELEAEGITLLEGSEHAPDLYRFSITLDPADIAETEASAPASVIRQHEPLRGPSMTLLESVRFNHLGALSILLETGADPLGGSGGNETPIEVAARLRDSSYLLPLTRSALHRRWLEPRQGAATGGGTTCPDGSAVTIGFGELDPTVDRFVVSFTCGGASFDTVAVPYTMDRLTKRLLDRGADPIAWGSPLEIKLRLHRGAPLPDGHPLRSLQKSIFLGWFGNGEYDVIKAKLAIGAAGIRIFSITGINGSRLDLSL